MKVDMWQTDYSIQSKLKFSPYSEFIYGSATQFDVFILSFSSFQCPRYYVSQTEVACFYMYQTSAVQL